MFRLFRRGRKQRETALDWRPYPDIAPETRAIVERVRPFTLTSVDRIAALCDAVRYLGEARIAGDIVECGVWKGGSSMAIALSLLAAGDSARTLYLYDTFEGMPPPTDADRSLDGRTASEQLATSDRDAPVWAVAGSAEVARNMAATGYPAERLRFVEGKVEETIPGVVPERIALLRLDTDWYESTRHEFRHLYPRLSIGGILVIDDYGHWQGARQATDEYFAEHGIRMLLHRIDYTGRIGVKLDARAGAP
jgi:hypothetical protein